MNKCSLGPCPKHLNEMCCIECNEKKTCDYICIEAPLKICRHFKPEEKQHE